MREIELTRGRITIVDDEDYEWLSQHPWAWMPPSNGKGTGYAVRAVYRPPPRRTVYMHREILGLGPGRVHVDHRNGDGLDNRRENLRIAGANGNQAASRHRRQWRGVYPSRVGSSRWRAAGKTGGRQFHLGTFDTVEEAARAWDAWALQTYGEFATLNFPVAE